MLFKAFDTKSRNCLMGASMLYDDYIVSYVNYNKKHTIHVYTPSIFVAELTAFIADPIQETPTRVAFLLECGADGPKS